MNPDDVLRGTARNEYNFRCLAKLQSAIPPVEWAAISAWISTFFGFQQSWLLDWSKFAFLLKCRQIGASHTYAAAAILWAMLGEDTVIVSTGQRESNDVLDKVTHHAEALRRLGSRWASSSDSASRCRLKTGGTVTAVPSTSGGRGTSGNVLLDEMAYYEHDADVWDGAGAAVMHGGKLRCMSTPNGVGNLFHRIWTDPKAHNGYRLHRVTLAEARADGMDIDDATCWRMARGDARVYDQFFNGVFLDGSAQYIPTDLITEASVDDLYTYEGEYFGGLDIGRTVDRTVLIVIRKKPDEQRVLAWIASCKRTDSDALEAMVDWAFQVFRLKRLCVDSTGIGAFPAERMQKKHGKLRVEPVVFTNQSKEDLATTLYAGFSERDVKIAKTNAALRLPRGVSSALAGHPAATLQPNAAEQLRQDLCAIRREVTTAGNVRYDAPRTDEGHADSAWAFALALHACGKAPGKKHEIAPQSAQERTGHTMIA